MLRLTSHVLDRLPNVGIGKQLFDIVIVNKNVALDHDVQLAALDGAEEVLRYRCGQDPIPSLLRGKCEDAQACTQVARKFAVRFAAQKPVWDAPICRLDGKAPLFDTPKTH